MHTSHKSLKPSRRTYSENGFLVLKKLWCCVSGRDENKNLVSSNELIKPKFFSYSEKPCFQNKTMKLLNYCPFHEKPVRFMASGIDLNGWFGLLRQKHKGSSSNLDNIVVNNNNTRESCVLITNVTYTVHRPFNLPPGVYEGQWL